MKARSLSPADQLREGALCRVVWSRCLAGVALLGALLMIVVVEPGLSKRRLLQQYGQPFAAGHDHNVSRVRPGGVVHPAADASWAPQAGPGGI